MAATRRDGSTSPLLHQRRASLKRHGPAMATLASKSAEFWTALWTATRCCATNTFLGIDNVWSGEETSRGLIIGVVLRPNRGCSAEHPWGNPCLARDVAYDGHITRNNHPMDHADMHEEDLRAAQDRSLGGMRMMTTPPTETGAMTFQARDLESGRGCPFETTEVHRGTGRGKRFSTPRSRS